MKRSLPALRLPRSPLIYVVAQARFSAVVSVDTFVARVQEELRHKGFPRFIKGQVPEFTFVGGALGAPKITFSDRYEFQSKDGDLGIVLTASSFAVHTNRYEDFGSFEKSLRIAADVVSSTLAPALVERVGLRYVDLIRLEETESWKDYLKSYLLGLEEEKVGVKDWTRKFEFIGTTDLGKLVVRCVQTDNSLPPDLQPPTLKYSEMLRPGETGTMLDFDHFSETSMDFHTDAIVEKVGALHDHIDKAFRHAVTDEALKKWGEEK